MLLFSIETYPANQWIQAHTAHVGRYLRVVGERDEVTETFEFDIEARRVFRWIGAWTRKVRGHI